MQPCPTTGCWLFTGCQDKDGYGALKNSGKADYKAHRVSWQSYVGEIPEGMEVAHYCDVRSCVNPAHLYVATHKQNIFDRTARKREPRGEQCTWSKLTKEAVAAIRESSDRASLLAKRFGISKAHVYRVKNFENWNH